MTISLRTNAKYLSPTEQFHLRKQIIRLRELDKTGREIASTLDVSEKCVWTTISSYRKHGFAGIAMKPRGRKHGEKRILSPEQETNIQYVITNDNPIDYGINSSLWTGRSITEYIQKTYGITLISSTLSYYLKRWNFSSQRPKKSL